MTIKGHIEDPVQIWTGNDMLANVADMIKTLLWREGGAGLLEGRGIIVST